MPKPWVRVQQVDVRSERFERSFDNESIRAAEINSIYALYEGEAAGLQARVSFTRAVFKYLISLISSIRATSNILVEIDSYSCRIFVGSRWSEAHRKKNELPDNTQLHLLVAQRYDSNAIQPSIHHANVMMDLSIPACVWRMQHGGCG